MVNYYLLLIVSLFLLSVNGSVELSDHLKRDPKLPETSLKNLSDYLEGRSMERHFLEDVGNKMGVFAVTKLGAGRVFLTPTSVKCHHLFIRHV